MKREHRLKSGGLVVSELIAGRQRWYQVHGPISAGDVLQLAGIVGEELAEIIDRETGGSRTENVCPECHKNPCIGHPAAPVPPDLTKAGGAEQVHDGGCQGPPCECPQLDARPPLASKGGGTCPSCPRPLDPSGSCIKHGPAGGAWRDGMGEVGADVRIRDYTEPLPPPRGGPIPGVPMFSAEHRAAVRAALCTVPDCPNAPAPGWLICADHGGGGGGGVTK